MKIPYSLPQEGSRAKRPLVDLVIGSASHKIDAIGLIDSGAEHNMFSVDVAEQCEIDLTHAVTVRAHMYDSDKLSLPGKLVEVNYKLGQHSWAGETVFVETDRSYGLLGKIGFFDAFDITFRYKEGIIELEHL